MEAKPLKYRELPGLSQKQLSEHHDILYAGYVKKINEIREKLITIDKTSANATFSELREIKLEEGFAWNGVILHEGYFDNMEASPISGKILKMIEEDFSSLEKWQEEFRALGMAARGWVVLAFDMNDGKLHNYLCDMHNQGGIWNCVALLIMDVYEHAYFIDYATARKAYIEAFMKNISWDEVNSRIEKYGVTVFRK